VIWNINAFDQWGVELGKRLSRVVFDAFENAGEPSGLDDSTTSLIKQVREWNC
jgi:glucose-6-phosphate isomerase